MRRLCIKIINLLISIYTKIRSIIFKILLFRSVRRVGPIQNRWNKHDPELFRFDHRDDAVPDNDEKKVHDQDVMNRSVNKLTARYNLIQSFFTLMYFPKDITNIILSYQAHEVEKTGIDFSSSYNSNKGKISSMINLDNGLLMSGYGNGTIRTWDPVTGKCIKKLYSIEKLLRNNIRGTNIKMCQISEHLIAITYGTIYSTENIAYILNFYTDSVLVFGHEIPYIKAISKFPDTTSRFVTMTCNCIYVWKIRYNDDEILFNVECVSKKEYMNNNLLCVIISSVNTMVVVTEKSDEMMNEKKKIIIMTENILTGSVIRSVELIPGETMLGAPVMISDKLFFVKMNEEKVIESVLMNINTLDYIKIISHQSDHFVHDITFYANRFIHLNNDYVAILSSKYSNKILIINPTDMTYIQTIEGDWKGNTIIIANHNNGFVAVTNSSKIKIYNYI